MWRNRDGIFLLEWRSHERRKKNFPMNHERHNIFSMNGGAGVVKINFPMSGEAANGEIYFHHDCCAIYYVPWVMNGEICPSLFLHIKGFTFPYKEWKVLPRFCKYMLICLLKPDFNIFTITQYIIRETINLEISSGHIYAIKDTNGFLLTCRIQ